jgi:DNA-directed RNA polymerase sigma subunit (sigma70/sigma32)
MILTPTLINILNESPDTTSDRVINIRAKKITIAKSVENTAAKIDRFNKMSRLFREGETLRNIGDEFNLSRQRVLQILREGQRN